MLNNIGVSIEPWGSHSWAVEACYVGCHWCGEWSCGWLASPSWSPPCAGLGSSAGAWVCGARWYRTPQWDRGEWCSPSHWKESSMSWVRRVTWSAVDFPRRKLACSFGSFGSITGSRRAWRRRSGRCVYIIHFTDGLPGELLVGIEEPLVADQLCCDGVGSDGAWFWFCCLVGQLIDRLPHSLAEVGEVD